MNDEIFINADPGAGNLPIGAICASNASRLDATFYTQPLTTFAIGGWDKDDLNAVLDFIAPAVVVDDRFEYRSFDNSSDFVRDEGDEDRRNQNGDFPRATPSNGVMVDAHTDERGFTIALDTKRIEKDSGYENREVMKVTQRLLRNELRRAFGLLDAAAVSASQAWSGAADPDMLLVAQIKAARAISGLKPNKVLFGDSAWTDRLTTYRGQNTAGGNTSASL
ncbi:MAG TPA: hypothetical protein PKJ41_14620, partial [Bryobacteraceae bacterium]|nr:hypothetical protein [Bryobacteraceae bacterium]